ARMIEPAEAAAPPVLVRALAGRRRLEIPARGEEALARAGDDADAQRRIVAKGGEDLVQPPALRQVDGVGLGPIEGHLEDGARRAGADSGALADFGHSVLLGYAQQRVD